MTSVFLFPLSSNQREFNSSVCLKLKLDDVGYLITLNIYSFIQISESAPLNRHQQTFVFPRFYMRNFHFLIEFQFFTLCQKTQSELCPSFFNFEIKQSHNFIPFTIAKKYLFSTLHAFSSMMINNHMSNVSEAQVANFCGIENFSFQY